MHSYLVALVVELVDHGVVGVLVGDVEGCVDGAPVGIFLALREQLTRVQIPVLVVDGVVEGDDHHLGDVLRYEAAGHQGAVHGAEAVWQRALQYQYFFSISVDNVNL